ncbi:hypothetical protein GGTG_12633 [Gaeumannomyces tritici R3-111a-1]|uniref:Uncharacterized protein n=1 Tax=Gaeumannomyces tritici (strain R3-111a-1) TaxID=644352 RepID=J3PGK4_GAET3|nr:hypothetical protein GGTG_12633 [Gaeumannomyces tritici R3-111a-1]EJT69750.1 hypothetical protein GGTG_12633 [Gaeumannomyces tritici R3-111a-1]
MLTSTEGTTAMLSRPGAWIAVLGQEDAGDRGLAGTNSGHHRHSTVLPCRPRHNRSQETITLPRTKATTILPCGPYHHRSWSRRKQAEVTAKLKSRSRPRSMGRRQNGDYRSVSLPRRNPQILLRVCEVCYGYGAIGSFGENAKFHEQPIPQTTVIPWSKIR